MTEEAKDLWQRAIRTLATAVKLVPDDPDSAASRAYYAAFHAVSACFAAEGRSFSKHSAVEAAVHRDLVNAGRCPEEVGIAFSALSKLRSTADYGSPTHVTPDEASDAISKAGCVVNAIRAIMPADVVNGT